MIDLLVASSAFTMGAWLMFMAFGYFTTRTLNNASEWIAVVAMTFAGSVAIMISFSIIIVESLSIIAR
jgi:hypothetical protein